MGRSLATCLPRRHPRQDPHGPWVAGVGLWLGTGSQRSLVTKFITFGEALCVVRSLRLDTASEWRAWCESGARPANVPANPDELCVHGGWIGWCTGCDTPTMTQLQRRNRRRRFEHARRAKAWGSGSGSGADHDHDTTRSCTENHRTFTEYWRTSIWGSMWLTAHPNV